MNEVLVNISCLVPDVHNSRVHSDKNILLIQRNFEKFGQYRPFVVQKSTMRVLVGNGLLSAMKQAGVTGNVKAVILDLNNDEANTLALIDNRSHDFSCFDMDKLFSQMENLDAKIASLLDFSSNISDSVIPDFRPPDESKRDDERGTIFVCGEYKIRLTRRQFLKWRERLQLSVGFNAKDQIKEIKKRIGLKNEN